MESKQHFEANIRQIVDIPKLKVAKMEKESGLLTGLPVYVNSCLSDWLSD